jgi:hypothetical protein
VMFPLPSTPSGAATQVNTGVVAMILGIRNPETLLVPESRVSFMVRFEPVPIPIFPPVLKSHVHAFQTHPL